MPAEVDPQSSQWREPSALMSVVLPSRYWHQLSTRLYPGGHDPCKYSYLETASRHSPKVLLVLEGGSETIQAGVRQLTRLPALPSCKHCSKPVHEQRGRWYGISDGTAYCSEQDQLSREQRHEPRDR